MKTCLITGCTRGLGRALAFDLHNQGYRVLGLARDRAALDSLEKSGVIQQSYRCDLASTEQLAEFLNHFTRDHQSLDLLIHNAGVQLHHSILSRSPEPYDQLIQRELQINFLAPVAITRALLPSLMQSESRVVVVTSLLQFATKDSAPGYSSSKAALARWAHSLRGQLRDTSVRVTEVIPGLIKTSMTQRASEKGVEPGILSKQILSQLQRDRILCKGAKLGYWLHRLWPALLERIVNPAESSAAQSPKAPQHPTQSSPTTAPV